MVLLLLSLIIPLSLTYTSDTQRTRMSDLLDFISEKSTALCVHTKPVVKSLSH